MLRSIIVALDGSESSAAARQVAIEIGIRYGASIAARAIVDSPWIAGPQPLPIGGVAYKMRRDSALLERAYEKSRRALREFEAAANAAGVQHTCAEIQGDPVELIDTEAITHDLIAIGRDANFRDNDERGTSRVLERLILDNPRPVLVAPREGMRLDTILISFDGSLASSRALHMFALLGIGRGRDVHVVSIDPIVSTAEGLTTLALCLLERHGIKAHPAGIAADTDPAKILLSQGRALNAGIIVMGAGGHHSVRGYLIGSCTRYLVETCPAALFIQH